MFAAMRRACLALFLGTVIGCVATGCALLPSPDITVKTLRSGSVKVSSTDLVFALGSGVTMHQHPTLCMILDTLQYSLHPPAQKFQGLPLTDTTVYPRIVGIEGATPIALRAMLEGRNGERLDSNSGAYSPGTGMDTPYNKSHLLDEGGEVLCLSWVAPPNGVTYVTLRMRSTRPVVVHELTWHLSRV